LLSEAGINARLERYKDDQPKLALEPRLLLLRLPSRDTRCLASDGNRGQFDLGETPYPREQGNPLTLLPWRVTNAGLYRTRVLSLVQQPTAPHRWPWRSTDTLEPIGIYRKQSGVMHRRRKKGPPDEGKVSK